MKKIEDVKKENAEKLADAVQCRVSELMKTESYKSLLKVVNDFAENCHDEKYRHYFDEGGFLTASIDIDSTEFFPDENNIEVLSELFDSIGDGIAYFHQTECSQGWHEWTASICLGEVVTINESDSRSYAVYCDKLDLKVDKVINRDHALILIENAMQEAGCFPPIVLLDYYGNFIKYLSVPEEIRKNYLELADFFDRFDDLTDLQRAVIEQLGYDGPSGELWQTLQDVCNHGASGGVSGFIYYSETCDFFTKNRTEIMDHAEKMAESLIQNALAWYALEETARELVDY